jgi:predicted transcriptional regulator
MKSLGMGELEAAIMDLLWAAHGWLTPGKVREALAPDRDLAYTTVMTVLVRLWRKGLLERERRGRAYAYRALHDREEHVASRMREVLESAADPAGALNHFVERLSAAQRRRLRDLLGGGPGR